MKRRFLFKNYGPDDQTIIQAIQHSVEISRKNNNSNIHIVFPRKSDFESTNLGKIIDQILGAGSAKKLTKGESIGSLDLLLPSRINSSNSSGTILAVYCTSHDMHLIDSNSSADDIIFVSWLPDEANHWENTWHNHGLIIMKGETSLNIPQIPEEIVQSLTNLTAIINLSTGLSHPSDKKHAEQIFKELSQKGYKADEEQIASWAMAHGWNASHLSDLKKLVRRYLS